MRQPVSTHTLARFAVTRITYRLQHTTKIDVTVRYYTAAMNTRNKFANLIGVNMPNLSVTHINQVTIR